MVEIQTAEGFGRVGCCAMPGHANGGAGSTRSARGALTRTAASSLAQVTRRLPSIQTNQRRRFSVVACLLMYPLSHGCQIVKSLQPLWDKGFRRERPARTRVVHRVLPHPWRRHPARHQRRGGDVEVNARQPSKSGSENSEHECVFVEEQEPSGRLILPPCLVCGVTAMDALLKMRREFDWTERHYVKALDQIVELQEGTG